MSDQNKEKKEHLEMIKRALLNVAPEFISTLTLNENKMNSERIFAYEFYHQLRIEYNKKFNAIYVNGEYRKGRDYLPLGFNQKTQIPDLIIHKPGTNDSNLVAIEIKSNEALTSTSLLRDLVKIEKYTNPNGLNFKIGIMIILNSTFEKILVNGNEDNSKKIKHILNNYPRISIWNIPVPIGQNNEHSTSILSQECLNIINKENLENYINNFYIKEKII